MATDLCGGVDVSNTPGHANAVYTASKWPQSEIAQANPYRTSTRVWVGGTGDEAATNAEGEIRYAATAHHAAAASLGSLETLSKLLVKPEAESDGTLEGLVREMLRPMLREWLDTNLPGLVETMVAREIAKITSQVR